MKVNIYNAKAEVVGEHELNPRVFDVAVNESLVHQAATAQLANERQVLAHTKDRGDVRGGGKKPWRQKGTGRARAGSSRSPLWRGGGVTFGPTNERNFSKKINSKMKRKAVCMVLSDKVRHEALIVLDGINFSEGKTKQAEAMLKAIEKNILKIENKATRSAVLILDAKDELAKRALKNLPAVAAVNFENINIIDLLKYRTVVTTKAGVEKIEKIYAAVRA
jgi:large subunit ribosomal protein L4